MDYTLWICFLIFLALAFDYINGFHDAANAIATVVSTRVLKPSHAVAWAAAFNFIAFFFFETKVAGTIGKGIIAPGVISQELIFATLVGAIFWNLFTWYFGIPSSSSHALVGGLVGAALVKSGMSALNSAGLIKICVSILVSPLLGLVLGNLIMRLSRRIVAKKSPLKVDGVFRKLQLVSSALYSLGHGGNDAQKTMGLIAALLASTQVSGSPKFVIPFWVVLSCYVAMGAGTLMGGWRIVKTMGSKIAKLKPIGGFCAETSGAITLFLASSLGIPVSTTHTITGSIVGVGMVRALNTVRWGVASRIVWAWVLTIPAAGLVSALVMLMTKH